MSIVPSTTSAVDRPSNGTLTDVVSLILDKGLVIDAYVRVSLVGIEILTIDARMVVASVDTYLRFAEATGRLDLEAHRKPGLPDLVQGVTGGLGLPDAIRGLTGAGRNAPAQLDRAVEAAQMAAAPARRRTAERREGKDAPVGMSRRRGRRTDDEH
jgi:hypothetical protein